MAKQRKPRLNQTQRLRKGLGLPGRGADELEVIDADSPGSRRPWKDDGGRCHGRTTLARSPLEIDGIADAAEHPTGALRLCSPSSVLEASVSMLEKVSACVDAED